MDRVIDWSLIRNFSKSEFDCQQTGENEMRLSFMNRLQALRAEYGRPMRISSGYRSQRHSIEAAKARPGAHTTGQACDISVSGGDALRIIELAIKHGFTGIGVHQKGSGRFIHLDDIEHTAHRPRPWIWSY